MTKGQRAMVAAKARILRIQTVGEAAEAVNVSTGGVDHASIVLAHGPDLAAEVLAGRVTSGVLPIDKAYEEARKRKAE